MVSENELATEAEIKEALAGIEQERSDDAAKKTLADKAAAEIMAAEGKAILGADGLPILPNGFHRFPDPPPDAVVLVISLIVNPMQERARISNTVDRDNFGKELIGKLAEKGIITQLQWHFSELPGCYIPEMEPIGLDDRWSWAIVDHPNYDPDRQVYDVVHDILGTGEEGTIG